MFAVASAQLGGDVALRHDAKPWQVRWGYALAVAAVAAATLVFLPVRGLLQGGQWGWAFLLVVGAVATVSGPGPAVLTAVLSFLAEDFFFIPPYGTFTVLRAADVVQLFAFLVVAVVLGWQAGRLRERQLAAESHEAEAEALMALSVRVASETSLVSMAVFVAEELGRLVGVERILIWPIADEGSEPAASADVGPDAVRAARPYVQYVLSQAKAVGLPDVRPPAGSGEGAGSPAWPVSAPTSAVDATVPSDDLFLPLQTTGGVEGVLQVGWGPDRREALGERDYRLVVSTALMIASFLTARRLYATEAQADAVREADRLKTALVSSVSHELKTPLASITAAVPALSSEDVTRDREQIRERLSSVTEDLGRLETSIADLLDISRLEAGQWLPRPETWEAGEIVADVVSREPESSRDRIVFDVPDPGPTVFTDFSQLSRALRNVVDNALTYGPAGSAVTIGARTARNRTLLWVEDRGPGVSSVDKKRVFEKFYRGEAGRAVTGSTGLGLSIAREIVQANAGTVWVEDADPHGARFVLSLPAEEASDTIASAAASHDQDQEVRHR